MNAEKVEKKSKNGDTLYQPDTLNSFTNGWQRTLFEKGSKIDIKADKDFERSRKVFASRRKQLTLMGKGNKPNATRPLEPHEVDKLYDYDFFQCSSPLVLQRTVWWKLTTNFGYCARDESRKLQFGDIKVNTDHNGCKYLEWDKERGTKT